MQPDGHDHAARHAKRLPQRARLRHLGRIHRHE
jgi:hypothetical protein